MSDEEIKGGVKDQNYTVDYDSENDEVLFITTITIRHKMQTLINEQKIAQMNLNKINEKIRLALLKINQKKGGLK